MKTSISDRFLRKKSDERNCNCIVLQLTLAILIALFVFQLPSVASARWMKAEDAPLQIRRHDAVIQVFPIAMGATWKLKGLLEMKVNNDQGRSLINRYKFPIQDELEELKIQSAEYFEGPLLKAIPQTSIVLESQDQSDVKSLHPFNPNRNYTIRFGDLKTGTVVRINYEITTTTSRIPGLFSKIFLWGSDYPILAGALTFESKEPLYFDVSKGARSVLGFSQGRTPDGMLVYKVDLKTPVYKKIEGEQGGAISSATAVRVQVSNQNSWVGVLDVLQPKFQPPLNDPLPPELQRIADTARALPTPDDRINYVIENLHQVLKYTGEWSKADGGLSPQKLSDVVRLKRADSKDFAHVANAIFRSIGIPSDVALVWRQNPSERLFIDEMPTTPSMDIFNHAIIRISEQGRSRFFDPSTTISFAEGFLSDVAGSWTLTLARAGANFERLPLEAPLASQIRISQAIDIRPDASIAVTGRVTVDGPLAAELKQVYLVKGVAQVEPYLRSLFGIASKSGTTAPIIQVNSKDRRGRLFDLSFTYVSPSHVATRGAHRELDLDVSGLAGIPLLSSKDRASDVILSKTMAIDVETTFRGVATADETNTSCLSLTSFASLIRETRLTPIGFTVVDNIRFKQDRIPASTMNTKVFGDELLSYSRCLSRARIAIGPRPAFEEPALSLTPDQSASLKKPITLFNLQDVKILNDVNSPQLNQIVQTKIFLAMRDMIRRGLNSPQIKLEYVDSLIKLGAAAEGRYLPMHLSEAAKLFATISAELTKTARYQRVHAQMLLAADRPNEALVAITNAMGIEKNQGSDAAFAAEVFLKLKNPAKAEEFLIKATTLPSSKVSRITAFESLAKLRLSQKNIADYSAIYNKAIYESPRNPWLYNNFAAGLASAKQFDQAIQNARRAVATLPSPEFQATLAEALIKKAEALYFLAPGLPTADQSTLRTAESLSLECLKYSRSHVMAFRIAGHASFLKALAGDYGSLIATQSYFAKALEMEPRDAWVAERYQAASQALSSGASVASIWTAMNAAKTRVPARQQPQSPIRQVAPPAIKEPASTNATPAPKNPPGNQPEPAKK
ncbi:MAG: hypothetical protein J0L82_13315 [Deltaproteobacteria bacterium]|nr:hypothetical protein [Deltaproteobacteria bacterium]